MDLIAASRVPTLAELAIIIGNGGSNYVSDDRYIPVSQHIQEPLKLANAAKATLRRLRPIMRQMKQEAIAHAKAMSMHIIPVRCSVNVRTTTQRTHRTQRSAAKCSKSSGSSDSDGGPSASDSSDRRPFSCAPLLRYPRFPSTPPVTLGIPASAHFIYGHARQRISTFLSQLAFSALRPILIDITTSYHMGVNYV